MILTEDDGIPSSIFEKEPEEYTVEQLKRWLKCRAERKKRGIINAVAKWPVTGQGFQNTK